MKLAERNSFKTLAVSYLPTLRIVLKPGTSQSKGNKEQNYKEVKEVLDNVIPNCGESDVFEAASILEGVTYIGRPIEVLKPPPGINAQALLTALDNDSSTVRANIQGVDVRLDIDQLKHQDSTQPIGTRQTHGGNKFKSYCDAQWHIYNTLPVIGEWARKQSNMKNGEKIMHGQSKAVDGIHYEGFCQNINGIKYVLFHCYPDSGTEHYGTPKPK